MNGGMALEDIFNETNGPGGRKKRESRTERMDRMMQNKKHTLEASHDFFFILAFNGVA